MSGSLRGFFRRLDSGRGVLLFGSAAILALAFLMTPSTEAVTVFGLEVPTLCIWRLGTGLPCPGCGLTRSFAFFAHGHMVDAFRMNALGPLLFVVVASQVPWQLYRIAGGGRPPAESG